MRLPFSIQIGKINPPVLPVTPMKDVTPEQRASIEKLIERFEEDEDVQNVFHNMKEEEDEE